MGQAAFSSTSFSFFCSIKLSTVGMYLHSVTAHVATHHIKKYLLYTSIYMYDHVCMSVNMYSNMYFNVFHIYILTCLSCVFHMSFIWY